MFASAHLLIRSLQLSSFILFTALSGCQMVNIKENPLSNSLTSKTDHILTSQHLSETTLQFLHAYQQKESGCIAQAVQCMEELNQQAVTDPEAYYAAASEVFLARALALDKNSACQQKSATDSRSGCLNEQLKYLDQSIRYSYVYLFKSTHSPESRLFDQRQTQVRTFYNYALSRLISAVHTRDGFTQLPSQFSINNHIYKINTDQYPSLKSTVLESLKSSYNMNFSGFYNINRQEGLGSEFVAVTATQKDNQLKQFVVDPERYFAVLPNPNIHPARFLPISAVIKPENEQLTAQEILNNAPLSIQLIDPYRFKTAQINNTDYTVTANYSVPYGLWLAESKMGSVGYRSLLNREEKLLMPHLFMTEPYQPGKKIIIMIHGLASSPETWVTLTNNIMGDPVLRDHYQVWQVFYSTNMPIFENRFQINDLLKQAFKSVQPGTESAHNAVLIGHSMGGIISRLLISDTDIAMHAIPMMNYEQHIQLQQNPVIRERFIFKPLSTVSRAIFIATPHHGSEYADRWYTQLVRKAIGLPFNFSDAVNRKISGHKNSTAGLIFNAPSDLSNHSRFMQLTSQIMPSGNIPFHSIMGNQTHSTDPNKMSDGIVSYNSSHLAGAQSEKIIKGGHSIHESPEAVMALRRILREHLKQRP